MPDRKLFVACVMALLTAMTPLAPARAQAQNYPKQKITLVVAFAAGGSIDTLARLIGQKLTARWGQPVVIENRVGAGGNIAAKSVIASEADGYTLLLTATGVAINQSLHANPGYAIDDLTPIIFPGVNTSILAVNPANPAQDLGQLLANVRGKSLTFGSAGVGTGGHLTGEYFFKVLAKVDAVHTPFAGGAPATNALIGNHIDAISLAIPDVAGQVKSGALRGLAVASLKRAGAVPDVRTFAEQGFPGFEAIAWSGLFAPAKTSAEICRKLNQAINEILQEAEVQERMATLGFDLNPQTLPQAQAFQKSELDKWSAIVRALGIKIN
jgi:tripartite-type tricarboxylate transporter receptor subunit TctC